MKARPPVGGGNIPLSWPNVFSSCVSDELRLVFALARFIGIKD